MAEITLNIMAVCFRRTQKGALEHGVIINQDQLIIDSKGKYLKKLPYEYYLEPYRGCIEFRFEQD